MKVSHRLASLAIMGACWAGTARAAILLNDSFTDGTRTNTSLPTDSAVYIGQSAANGSNGVSAGKLSFTLPTNSLKVWTYFTSDNSAPDGNQPHNAVTQVGVGSTLTASMTFIPSGLTSISTSKNFRFGVFFDPTDARVQVDANSDGGTNGTITNPWTDATGYAVQIPLNATSSGNTPILLEKRTTSNTSLLGSSSAYTAAPTAGTSYSLADGTSYTLQLSFSEASATDMLVSATLLQGTTVLSSASVHDLGTSFGGTAIAAGLLTGSQSIYTNFDHFFFRENDNTQATGLDFTNFSVVTAVPEPASLSLLTLTGAAMLRRKRLTGDRA